MSKSFDEQMEVLERRMREKRVGDDFVWQPKPSFGSRFFKDKRGSTTLRKILYGGIALGVIGAIAGIGYYGLKHGWFGDDDSEGEPAWRQISASDTDGDGINDLFVYEKETEIWKEKNGMPYPDKDITRIRRKVYPNGTTASIEISNDNTRLNLSKAGMEYTFPQNFSQMPYYPIDEKRTTYIYEVDGQYFLNTTIVARNQYGRTQDVQVFGRVPLEYLAHLDKIITSEEPTAKIEDAGLLVWRLKGMKPGEEKSVSYAIPIDKPDINLEKTNEELEELFKTTAKGLGSDPELVEERHVTAGGPGIAPNDIQVDSWGYDTDFDGKMNIAFSRRITKSEWEDKTYNLQSIGMNFNDNKISYNKRNTNKEMGNSRYEEQQWRIDEDGDGFKETTLFDNNDNGIIEGRTIDENNDGEVEYREGDRNEDGIIDTLARDTDGDFKIDESLADHDYDGEWDSRTEVEYRGEKKIEKIDENYDGKFEQWIIRVGRDNTYLYDTNEDGKPDMRAADTDGDNEYDLFEYDDDGDFRPDRWIRGKGKVWNERGEIIIKIDKTEEGNYTEPQEQWEF